MAWLKPRQYEPLSIVPIVTGAVWLFGHSGLAWWVLAAIPGVLILSAGVSLLLWPGDLRHTEYLGAGAVIGFLVTLPAMLVGGFELGAVCLLLSIASYLVSGRLALAREPVAPGAPEPERSLIMDAKVGLDEALLGYFVGTASIRSGEGIEAMVQETLKIERLLEDNGWHDHPERFHHEPPSPPQGIATADRIYGNDFERVLYPSEFVAHADLPGSRKWADQKRNTMCATWVMRHEDAETRPWLVCIHGYRMGFPWMDFGLFAPGWLHRHLGLNLFMPVLPAHGPRRIGPRSGDYYLDGDLYNVIHAQTQALWDLRRSIKWIRAQDPSARIGVLGYSLGGYNTALLAAFEPELDFVVAGIPVADFAAALWRHLPPEHVRYLEAEGLDQERYRRILRVISPLAHAPKVPADRRYIFAGAGDRVVLPAQCLQLARHWEVPIQWYQGAHLTFRGEANVRAHIEAAMQRAGWAIDAGLRPART
jgi:dienelactone hydrolase